MKTAIMITSLAMLFICESSAKESDRFYDLRESACGNGGTSVCDPEFVRLCGHNPTLSCYNKNQSYFHRLQNEENEGYQKCLKAHTPGGPVDELERCQKNVVVKVQRSRRR